VNQRHQLPEWAKTAILLAIIIGAAAFLRLYKLDQIPPGLHGDEAYLGLQTMRFIDDLSLEQKKDDWLHRYTADPLGAPVPLMTYVTYALFSVFGISTYVLRSSAAIMGIAAILFIYFCGSQMFNKRVGIFSAIFAALSIWHIHYSRTAFPAIYLPLLSAGALYFLFAAQQNNRTSFFILSGFFAGIGLYTYGVYPIFLAPFMLYVGYLFIRRATLRKGCFILLIATLIAAAPFISTSIQKAGLEGRIKGESVFNQEKYKVLTPTDRFIFLVKKSLQAPTILFLNYKVDHSDGMGVKPPIDTITGIFVIVGLIICFAKIKDDKYALLLFLILTALAGFILTEDGRGFFRRTISGIVPLMLVAGIGADNLYSRIKSRTRYAPLIFLLIFSVLAFTATSFLIKDLAENERVKWVFVYEFTSAIDYVKTLDPQTKVYFYSDRWSWNYETRKFLLPSFAGEDRSRKFGNFSIEKHDEHVVYILLPDYANLLENITRAYPGGITFDGKDKDKLLFSAYVI
jgi:hypothetical protein